MAYMIPETIRSSATAGERLVFNTLKNYIPEDYIVYYEPEINGKRPDFVIIGPDLGLVVLEVKDYTQNTLLKLDNEQWFIRSHNNQTLVVKNPLKQAREYAFHINDKLKRDKNLILMEGNYRGNLKFPFGYGTVFTRLKQEYFVSHDLYNLISPEYVLTRDEIDPEDDLFSEEILLEKLFGMFHVRINRKIELTQDDINAIRYHLFPEVRISSEFKQPVYYQDQLLLSLHNIKTMDLHQEKMAKQLGDKHRLIRGVAGSGKTIILASRAKLLLKEHPDWKILILCYNISLSSYLSQLIQRMMDEPEDLFDLVEDRSHWKSSIQVYNFHAWLKHELKISEPQIPMIIEKIRNNEVILPTYDAIMIDEGQDFEAEWLQLVSCLLNPSTQSLLLVEDRAQNIYKRNGSLKQDIGLDFRGRSKILTINYRNTAQIVEFAWNFYQRFSQLQKTLKVGSLEGMEILLPQSTKRRGPEPVITKCDNFNQEVQHLIQNMRELHQDKKIPYSDMAIIYRVKNDRDMSYINVLQQALKKQEIPYYWLCENDTSKRNLSNATDAVHITTVDSSKGLDYRAVFIVNIENMPFALEKDIEREVALFYIGMTRAQDYLFLSYSGESTFTKYLNIVLQSRTMKVNFLKSVK